MEGELLLSVGRLDADELLLILAYRRCEPRRKEAVRTFTNAMSSGGEEDAQNQDPAVVIQISRFRQ
jgi:hypothetical protein